MRFVQSVFHAWMVYNIINIAFWDFWRIISIWQLCRDLELLLSTDRPKAKCSSSSGSLFRLSRTNFYGLFLQRECPSSNVEGLELTGRASWLSRHASLFGLGIVYKEPTVSKQETPFIFADMDLGVFFPPTFAPCRWISFMFIQLKRARLRETEMGCHSSFLPGHAFK